MIPKNIHTIWVGPNEMPYRERGLRPHMKEMHPMYGHYLWRDENIQFAGMPPNMQKLYDIHYNDKKWAFAADVLRLWVVYKYGGVYMDVDFDFQKPLDDLLDHSAFICYHPTQPNDHTVVNGVFGAEEGHQMMKALVDEVQDSAWWVGPEMVGRTIKKWLNMPYEVQHYLFKERMENEHDIQCVDWKLFDSEYAKHLALYSWK